MTNEFTIQTAFEIDEGTCGDRFKACVTHETATGKLLDIHFIDRGNGNLVSVPADLWDRVVAAVERKREF